MPPRTRGRELEKLPRHHLQYRDLLSSHAPVEAMSAGPASVFIRDRRRARRPSNRRRQCLPVARRARRLDSGRSAPAALHGDVEDGNAVAVCASVRISAAVHCAGVETRPEHRHRAHAVNVAARWARAVRALGATPFDSTSWENLASRRVAARLGLPMVAVAFSIT